MEKNRLLTLRGVGKKFHTMSLTQYQHSAAKEVLEWIETSANMDLKLGRALTLVGKSDDAYNIAMLTARALILSGFDKLKCSTLFDAVDDEFISIIYEKHPPLMITNFVAADVDFGEYKRLENCLTYYLDNLMPVFIHTTNEEWNDAFADRVNKTNKVIVVT